jgi:predicted small lipoprotein YifL
VNRALKINFAALALVGLAAGALGGCGRAGPLEPPPDAQAVAKQQANAENNSGVPQARPRPKPIQAPNQPFFLDPLL